MAPYDNNHAAAEYAGHTAEHSDAQHADQGRSHAAAIQSSSPAAADHLRAQSAAAIGELSGFCGFVPYRGQVLVKRVAGPGEWILPAGFAVPDAYKKRSQWAVVLAIGADVDEVKPGDIVMLKVWGGFEVAIETVGLIVIKPELILAVLDD